MQYDPRIHHRRSIRVPGYDYTAPGGYFLTLVSENRECLFGSVEQHAVILSTFGTIIADTLAWLAQQYPYVEVNESVIMPNHLHTIWWIHAERKDKGNSHTASIKPKPLGSLVGAFKTVSTKQINLKRGTPGAVVWQRNYYEHIIRDGEAYDTVRAYIHSNPMLWDEDRENPLAPR